MQLQRVVIGTDFSGSAMAAARWAAQNLGPATELVLAHAIQLPDAPRFLRGRLPSRELFLPTLRAGAEARLQQSAAQLAPAAVSVRVREGSPAEQIAALADEANADLVVVGRHGDRPGLWNRLGSTAERLVRTAHVPVLLINGTPATMPKHLLVAIDESEIAGSVLAWARQLGERFGAHVTVLHVVSSAVLGHVLSMAAVGAGDVGELGDEEVRADFRAETDRWLRELIGPAAAGGQVTSEVAFGEAGQEILAAADRLAADMIIVGSRGAGAVRRAILGSVATEVLRGADRPVLVVTEPADELEELGPGRSARYTRRVGGGAPRVEVPRADWATALREFTDRNANRRVVLEVYDSTIGLREEAMDCLLRGVAYDPAGDQVDVMLGELAGTSGHLTHSVRQPQQVEIIRATDGRDEALWLKQADGRTLLLVL